MHILITGAKGQLGTDCGSVLSRHGEVVGFDLPELDITNRFQTLEVLTREHPDIIVNCAAYTAVDACESDPACWLVNENGPGYLAEWAADNNAFLIHISTDYVFAGDKPLFEACAESERPAPGSEYGRSKLAGEEAVLNSGADAAILRTAWLYGASGKNFLKTMLRVALQDADRDIRVVNDQFGSPTWSYTLARQIAAVIDARATGIFHATSEGFCSWYDLADCFLMQMGFPGRVVPCTSAEYPTPTQRPANSILENRRLKESGVNVFKDWREELDMFITTCGKSILNEERGLIR